MRLKQGFHSQPLILVTRILTKSKLNLGAAPKFNSSVLARRLSRLDDACAWPVNLMCSSGPDKRSNRKKWKSAQKPLVRLPDYTGVSGASFPKSGHAEH